MASSGFANCAAAGKTITVARTSAKNAFFFMVFRRITKEKRLIFHPADRVVVPTHCSVASWLILRTLEVSLRVNPISTGLPSKAHGSTPKFAPAQGCLEGMLVEKGVPRQKTGNCHFSDASARSQKCAASTVDPAASASGHSPGVIESVNGLTTVLSPQRWLSSKTSKRALNHAVIWPHIFRNRRRSRGPDGSCCPVSSNPGL